MKKRTVRLPLLLLALVFIVFLIRRWNEPQRKEAFDRTPASLVFSSQALCIMDCRRISKEAVADIIRSGVILFNKSNRMARPCPVFSLQGRTSGGEKLRVVFSQCAEATTVINCYNLQKELTCHCPDNQKKENP